jgi:hypothetical protein
MATICKQCNNIIPDIGQHVCWPNNFQYSGYVHVMPQQGWQCPVCLKVYSPVTAMCWTDHTQATTTVTTATTTSLKPRKTGKNATTPAHQEGSK